MTMTPEVKKILSHYESDCPGTKANLARILMHGRFGGTGKLVIFPVDQGFEHGPARSFAKNPEAYDPHYHFNSPLTRAFGLCRTAWHVRSRGGQLRRADPDHFKSQQLQLALA